ncbi:MAG TPA: photosynthetic reaction center cytochrome PufC [Casimicrobiaceae bacterium]
MSAQNLRFVAAALCAAALVAGCEKGPMDSIQRGYRGLGMVEIFNPNIEAAKWDTNQAPPALPAAAPGSPPASAVFKNLQVLNDLSVAELTRLMVAMTNWVAPQQGCPYCHEGANLASDALYTKVVARRMLQMTRTINADNQAHVAITGVTCYTCHRGQNVPSQIWFLDPGPKTADGPAGNRAGQNWPAPAIGLTSLPFDPFTPFLEQDNEIRVISTTALPSGDHKSVKQTEWTYALMMHISQALNVNCTYCHNTRSFAEWDASTPQRAVAWHAIRTVRQINADYLVPLKPVYPANRLGPTGDPPKANCATCHQGAFKPLFGAPMLKDYPELTRVGGVAGAAAAAGAPASDVLAKVLFDTGKKNLGTDANAAIARVVDALKKNAAMTVDVSGFADRTGNPEQNLQLAKERALAVRDALQGAGIGGNRINLKKPEFVIGGAEADARRVDVVAVK